ncbi:MULTISPECIES: cupin domain-containing protein [Streptomyces]|uniref:Cupin type-2 domain-containing protein n=1 Tax=Streptomyces luteosporeus TaxID=173856 RepID=A0ABP6G5W8_9ACTN
MREAVVVAATGDPADVYGVHAAEGHSRWTCLARRTGLHGGWEAVEWAWLPPGGVSGEHRHTRTEELYFVLTGAGELTLDGRSRPVAPGTAVLTATGSRHGLRNAGRTPLSWLVVEVPAPRPSEETTMHDTGNPRSTVVPDLPRNGPLDASGVLTGPLRTVRVTRLPPGATGDFDCTGTEHTVYVTGGTGTARAGGASVPLAAGVALTLPLGTGARLRAGARGLEYFHAVLAVPTEEQQ